MTDSRIEKLNSINFVWDSKEPSRLKPDGDEVDFDALYTSLVKFKQTYGHVQVHKYKQNNNQPTIEFKRLTTFVSFVRKEHENYIRNKPSLLDAERVQNLTELGVAWKRPGTFEWCWVGYSITRRLKFVDNKSNIFFHFFIFTQTKRCGSL